MPPEQSGRVQHESRGGSHGQRTDRNYARMAQLLNEGIGSQDRLWINRSSTAYGTLQTPLSAGDGTGVSRKEERRVYKRSAEFCRLELQRNR